MTQSVIAEIGEIKWDAQGLVPCMAIDYETKTPLMLAYMNEAALKATLETRRVTYFSRSRQALWVKGETSGHTQTLVSLHKDCDGDALVAQVIQTGAACHTGSRSCFFEDEAVQAFPMEVLSGLAATIKNRREMPVEGSYTNYLLEKGLDKILKKVGEESTEVIIGAKNSKEEVVYEAADLVYHMLVLFEVMGIDLREITEALHRRKG